VVDAVGKSVFVDNLQRHVAITGIRQRNGSPFADVDDRDAVECVAIEAFAGAAGDVRHVSTVTEPVHATSEQSILVKLQCGLRPHIVQGIHSDFCGHVVSL